MADKIIKCPMKVKNVFPYGEVPIVDSEKLKKELKKQKGGKNEKQKRTK